MHNVALITNLDSKLSIEIAKINAKAGGSLVLVSYDIDKLNLIKAEFEKRYQIKVKTIHLKKDTNIKNLLDNCPQIDYVINDATYVNEEISNEFYLNLLDKIMNQIHHDEIHYLNLIPNNNTLNNNKLVAIFKGKDALQKGIVTTKVIGLIDEKNINQIAKTCYKDMRKGISFGFINIGVINRILYLLKSKK